MPTTLLAGVIAAGAVVCCVIAAEPTGGGPGAGGGGGAGAPAVKDPGNVEEAAAAFPHPLITEVLFAVPTGPEGDANKDGVRQVSGDEFIEIVNPHARPIQLLGYVLTDSSPNPKTQMRFRFPAMELKPGGVVVVFNGNGSTFSGPVGDGKSAPAKPDERFDGAWVFTMRASSSRTAFSNASDAVILRSPDGAAVQRVRWGKAGDNAAEMKVLLDEVAPAASKCSVSRSGKGKGAVWRAHTDDEAGPFSPGRWRPEGAAAPPQSPGPGAPAAGEPVAPGAGR